MKRPSAFLLMPALLVALSTPGSALGGGRPERKVYFQSNQTDTAYQKKTCEKVAAKWKAPAASQIPEVGKKTVVQAVIGRDGALTSAVISMKSDRKSVV